MDTYSLSDELRLQVDDIRAWLLQPRRMPDCARKAAHSLVELVVHDLDLIEAIVEYFVRPSSDVACADRLPIAGRFAFDMASIEQAKLKAVCSSQRLVAERFCGR